MGQIGNVAKHGVTQYLTALSDVGMVFFEITPDLLIYLDQNGEISRVNPAFIKKTGYSEIEVMGKGIAQLIDPYDLAEFIRTFRQRPIVRLLHRETGTIRVKLVAYRFRLSYGFLEFRLTESRGKHEHHPA